MMKNKIMYVLLAGLAGCSSGGSSSGDTGDSGSNLPPAVERNVALSSNGATIAATYDSDNAEYVIDGDTTEDFYWSGNINSDSFTIDFGEVVDLSDITIFTNDLTFSTSNPNKILEISEDGDAWKRTSEVSGGDVPCLNSSTGDGKMYCEFMLIQRVRYIKVTITTNDSPELIKIFEIEATGV